MPKLYFRYGAMNSSKTANLLMVAYNYRSQGKSVILIKPNIDNRVNILDISSRMGINMKADIIASSETDLSQIKDTDCILVDECQFLTPLQIEQLRTLTVSIPVICYGLRTDYRTILFPGSKRLMELADNIEEVKTICVLCNNKAIINAKFSLKNNKKYILKKGSSEPDIGAEEKYQSMCWFCWNI
jgi:thymidine kinase